MSKSKFLLGLGFVLILGATPGVRAQGGITGSGAGVEEKLGAQVALDSVLKDEDGNDVTLRQLIDKPTILTLNYFRCSGICTPLLNGLADALNQIKLEPGKQFQVITLSFDPLDTPEVAREKRINYLKEMTRPFPPSGWRFLTGSAQATKAVTDSVGFSFRATDYGFDHAGVIIALTPKGIVSRYMYGITFIPADLEMAMQEAASGQVRPSISRVLALCFSYDPQGKRYVINITRVGGVAVLILAGAFVIFLLKGKARAATKV
jgi:protein SCO1/2